MTTLDAFRWPRGGPIAMLALVLGGWISARAMMWHNPFVAVEPAFAQTTTERPVGPAPAPPVWIALAPASAGKARGPWQQGPALVVRPRTAVPVRGAAMPDVPPYWQAEPAAAAAAMPVAPARSVPVDPPFIPAPRTRASGGQDSWSLDAWAFWRQGSDAAPVSQGRVPIYGASQVGAVLQYRIAPSDPRDPRLHTRAYRAMVRRGEEEVALGASVRPLARVPVRIAGELRLTDAAFRNEARPSAFAVTELPPFALPYGARIEAYGQAGWVGGTDATAFADGQASILREVGAVAARSHNRVRLTVGAGTWGGAQEGVHRLDVGPTMRLDLVVADTPLRLSVDWRERVAGAAAPASGMAATVSARF